MATITLNVPAASISRIQAAVGFSMNLGGPASAGQVKEWLIDLLKRDIRMLEQAEQEAIVSNSFSEIDDIT